MDPSKEKPKCMNPTLHTLYGKNCETNTQKTKI